MAVQVRLGGTWNTITAAKVFAGSSWRSLKAIQVFANGAWRVVANFTPPAPPSSGGGGGGGAISLSVSPNPCSGSAFSSTVTTNYCTVTPHGGQAPFSYAWSIVSGGPVTINSPTSAFTNFTKTGVPSGTGLSAVAKCDVADSLGVTASITVDLFFLHDIVDHGGTQ